MEPLDDYLIPVDDKWIIDVWMQDRREVEVFHSAKTVNCFIVHNWLTYRIWLHKRYQIVNYRVHNLVDDEIVEVPGNGIQIIDINGSFTSFEGYRNHSQRYHYTPITKNEKNRIKQFIKINEKFFVLTIFKINFQ